MDRPRGSRGSRGLVVDARGVVYVEFLFAVLPVFMLCMAIMQLALLQVAGLVVRHAAWAGARAAAVILDDDPVRYDGVACGVLAPTRDSRGPDLVGPIARQLAGGAATGGGAGVGAGGAAAGTPQPRARRGGPRLSAIRRAVSRPLAVLAPDAGGLGQVWSGSDSLAQTLGDGPLSRLAIGLGFYDDWVAAVTFPEAPGSPALYGYALPPAAEGSEVTVRVTYLQRCGVPLVGALMCDDALDFALDHARARVARGRARKPPAHAELRYVPSPAGLAALLAGGGHFAVLTGEATLPRHAAPHGCLAVP